jgi:hypothetical protein
VPGDAHNPHAPEGVAVHPGTRPNRDWVAPELTAADPERAMIPEPAAAGRPTTADWTEAGARRGQGPEQDWSDERAATEPPPLPVPLGPMTVTDLLDGAWAVLSGRARTVLALTALTMVPADIVAALLVGERTGADADDAVIRLVPFLQVGPGVPLLEIDGATVVAMAVLSLGLTMLGAALGKLVVAWYGDRDLSLREVLGSLVRRLPTLLVAWLVMVVVQGAALAVLLVPALFVIPLFLLVGPVIGIERRGPFSALRRSARLVGRRMGAVIGIWLVSLFVERIVAAALVLAPEIVSELVPESVAPLLRASGWAAAQFVTAPVVAGLSVLLYIDLRVRTEGIDLLVEADAVFPEPDLAR